jgi:hypothetical protein
MGDALSVSRLGGNGLKRRADAALLSRKHPNYIRLRKIQIF